ncbi:MAG: TlpA family protein disulfide reductase [Anaerolineales bacterium]|nr:TlpA family protein disulfide reductase [Anaerolineales bacterium]
MKKSIMNKKTTGKKNNSQKTNLLPIILVGLGIIALIAVGLILNTNQGEEIESIDTLTFPPIEVNQPAPELTLFDLDGNEVSLTDFQGEVILVNNWATWCPPCREEMPEFKAYYDKYKDQGFQVVAIEAGEPEAEVRNFVEGAGLDFVILLDPENKSLITFQQNSLPNSFVIDRKGNLRLAWLGAINDATLEKYVTPLLKE